MLRSSNNSGYSIAYTDSCASMQLTIQIY